MPAAADTTRHRALSAASRVRMLDLLRRAGSGLTAAEVVEATGLHPSTVRAHLDQLADSGLATRTRAADGTPGRPAWRYRATDLDRAAPPSPYQDLAAALIGQLTREEDDPHLAGVRAGRDWGRRLAASLASATSSARNTPPMDGLVEILDRLGFTPHVVDPPEPGAAEVHLRSCPFLDLALAHPDVVCGVHLGVINGALASLGAPATQTDLQPFAVPGACVVRVGRGGRSPGTSQQRSAR